MNKKKKKKKVLIVEDTQDLLYAMKLTLLKVDFSVTLASNGREGLEKYYEALKKQEPFDLIITDIQMPDITGIELIDEIQKQEIETPILVITGYGSKELVVNLMRLGCLDYLDKPFKPSELIEHVNAIMEKFTSRKEIRDKKYRQLKEEAVSYESQVEYYRRSLEEFEKQINSAKGAYENLVQVKPENMVVPVSWRMRQLADLGGDFLDMKKTAAGCDILVADVSGHDMGASYHAVLLKAFFDENSRTGLDGITFFNMVNRELLEKKESGRMITAIFVRISPGTLSGEVVSAGHPLLIRTTKKRPEPFAFQLTGDVLGVHQSVHFEKRRFDMKPGDRYFLYTDGIIDASYIEGVSGKKMKLSEHGLERLIQKHNYKSLDGTISDIWDDIMVFCHFKPPDDMLFFAFEIPGEGEKNVRH